MTNDSDKTTHFGFETVAESDKAGRVQGVFNSVASTYDIMNDVMSVGIHRVWKEAMMDWLAPRAGQKLLDVAGGTGDVSFKFLGRAGSGHATVLDLTEPMLVEGRKRAEAAAMAAASVRVAGASASATLFMRTAPCASSHRRSSSSALSGGGGGGGGASGGGGGGGGGGSPPPSFFAFFFFGFFRFLSFSAKDGIFFNNNAATTKKF